MKLRDFLNRLIWDQDFDFSPEDYEITYIHRGAPNDELRINCSEISNVNPSTFEYFNDYEMRDVIIPFHRIKIIENIKNHEIVYIKKGITQNV